jgi:hypothetical protein
MRAEPFQVLRADGLRSPSAPKPRLVIAGATGALGNEMLRRLGGLHRFATTEVLARETITAGLSGVSSTIVAEGSPADWPATAADTGIVLFDPPRLFFDRERALWTPTPEQLPGVARWMRRSGVTTLLVALPHEQGRLPEALKRGLASLDEQAVAALGFDRLIIIRTPNKPGAARAGGAFHAIAHWMLSILKYMVPSSEQPVRAVKVADFAAAALEFAPPGVHIAAPETVWRAAQGDARAAVRQWLGV